MSSNLPGPASFSGAAEEKLTIETPEQTALEFPLAGIGSRFLALALDSLIQWAVGFALFLVGVLSMAGLARIWQASSLWTFALLLLSFFAIYFGYFAVFEAIWNGQTPGKRITRIRVIKDSGQPITAIDSVARNLLRIVDQMPFFYGVGIVSVLMSRQNKRLGDFVAGTVVVHEKALEDIHPAWEAAQTAAGVAYRSDRLTPEEFALIEMFLSRRNALAPDVRSRMAAQILDRIKGKLTLSADPGMSTEKFLEAIAQERRSLAGFR